MHHHVTRQVLVHAPQSVTQPCAETRTTWDLTAGLNVGDCWIVINGFRKCAVDNTEFFGHARCMREKLADPYAAIVVLVLSELVLAWAHGQRRLSRRHSGDALAIAHVLRQRFAKHLLHFGFVIPEIVVAGAAAHEQVYHTLGFRGVVQSRFGASVVGMKIGAKQIGQGSRSQSQCRTAKELPTSEVQVVFTQWVCIIHAKTLSFDNTGFRASGSVKRDGGVTGQHGDRQLRPRCVFHQVQLLVSWRITNGQQC